MRIKNFSEVVGRVQSHLNDYLGEHGFNTSRNFNCLSPKHNDKSPSCGSTNGITFHCFGCGEAGDIFKAAHYLEGKPLVGKEWVVDNLMYLAEKYKIPLDASPLSDEDIYEIDTYAAYKFAAEYVTSCTWTPSVEAAMNERGWKQEVCKEYGVGCVTSFKEFREHLKNLGYSASFLDDVDLGRKEIFDDDHIIYVVKDEHGRPVGFASRNLKYTKDNQNGTKYSNQKTTGAKCNIYRKGSRLFGMDQLIKKHSKKSDPVYIVEGYSDVISASYNGFTNCVAIGGSAFTAEQLQLLKDNGYYNIVLCLDGDTAGKEETKRALDTTLGCHKDVRVSVISIPKEMDPDDYIRAEGITAFKALKKWSAFEWRLSQFGEEEEAESVCKSMIPLIVNESSHVQQEKMVKILAEHTGVSQKAILADVHRLQNSREADKVRERSNVIEKVVRTVQKSTTDAEVVFHEALSKLTDIAKRYEQDSLSGSSCIELLDAQKNEEESKTGEYQGFRLGEDLRGLEEAFTGEWREDVWLAWGGKANAGKTALMCKMAYEIASRVEENNAIVIYHSIDDTAKQLTPRFIAIAEGSRQLKQNQVRDPKFYAKQSSSATAKKVWDRRDAGYQAIRKLMQDERLIIKDANAGKSLAYADMLVGAFREKHPDRSIVYILDNFHKLQDFQKLDGDERNRFKTMSTYFKELATKWHICIMSTVEYTKLQRGIKPSNNNIGETVQIEYDVNAIVHLYNDMHEHGDQSPHYHLFRDDYTELDKKFPRIEAIIGKNKISDVKGSVFLDFYPDSSDFSYVDPSIAEEDEVAAEEVKKQEKANKYGGESNYA